MTASEGTTLASALGEFPVFADLPASALQKLAAGAIVQQLADATQVFAQGDAADAVYAILRCDGRVRVGVPDAASKRLMVEVFREREIFGEMGVIDGGDRSADATTDGNVRLARLRGAQFLDVLATTPALGSNLLRLLSRRLRRTFALFQDAIFEPLEVRLARQILYLAAVGARRTDGKLRIAGRFRQGDLADLLGATTRSIITILNGWRADGIVEYDSQKGFVTIVDEPRFRAIVEHA
ncbi:MAG: Crp/Fnr family transcriptional regulator, partial [Alphaproteobacteria bacterium]|nr:Crp/Fnr family transcriptional regulator [Alphaproteobacteria bacterium]